MHAMILRSSIVAAALLAGAAAPAARAQAPAAPEPVAQQASDRGTVSAVTLYPDRASVTRSVKAQLKQGLWTLRIPDLPRSVDPRSLQAKVSSSGTATDRAARLLGVEFSATPRMDFASSPEGAALADKVRDLRRQLAYLAQDRAALDSHEKLVDQVGIRPTAAAGPEGATQPLDLAAVERQLEAVRAEKKRILDSAREMGTRKERLEREVSVAEEQLASRGGADRTERAGLVQLAVPQDAAVEVEFTYLVKGAGWAPAYAVRAAADRSAVSVEYDALVVQSTGEDWNGVRLSLSTAEPTRASGPPPVEPWFVDVYVPPPPVAVGAPVTRAMTAAPMAMADAVPGSPAEPGAAGAENVAEMRKALEDLSAGAAVNDNGTAVSFELPRPVTLVSDASRQQRTRIGNFEPKSAFTYVAAPILSESVYLRGDLVNDSAFQLLPGRAQVFMGGDFVGDSTMPSVAPKDEFRVFFGPDRALRAKREVASRSTGTSGLFGGSTATTWSNRITVDNGTGRDVRIELYDRRPVSRNERIEAKLASVVPALSTDKAYVEQRMPQGILRWDLTLPASARGPKSATIAWTVGVTRPADLPITPVPD
jgi:uncharacterized protein (TIGR02231 family)